MRFAVVMASMLAFGSAIRVVAQNGQDQKAMRVSLPNKSWELQVDAKGFVVKVNETQSDGRRYLVAENAGTGVTLSVTLEQVTDAANVEGCRQGLRNRVQANSKLNPTDVSESQAGDVVILEFVLPQVEGMPIQQKNVFGCLAKDNVYADVHLSKVQFKPQDEQLFTSVLNTVHFTGQDSDDASTPRSSKYFLGEGSKYFRDGQFDKAIAPYQKALDLEKGDRKLDINLWRVLVDNLGMAYGVTGNLKASEEVFQYGISRDPTYPLFYYNVACVHAEKNDLDSTMEYLRKAFEYRLNVIPGEKMPDPHKDDSFQRFLQTEKFRKLIDSF
jgi:tetratricopeptide (TPR) repeat protein